MKQLIGLCLKNNIHFVYAISPGLDITYHSQPDNNALFNKCAQIVSLGVTHFAILFDDIELKQLKEQDAKYFASYAQAQAHVSNNLLRGLKQKIGESFGRLFFCPTQYCARMASPNVKESSYLIDLGDNLDKQVDIFWTVIKKKKKNFNPLPCTKTKIELKGPEIISTHISADSLIELSKALKRKPTIWDNFFANDYDMRRVYMGPYDQESRPFGRKH